MRDTGRREGRTTGDLEPIKDLKLANEILRKRSAVPAPREPDPRRE
jgi:hypothetical protein